MKKKVLLTVMTLSLLIATMAGCGRSVGGTSSDTAPASGAESSTATASGSDSGAASTSEAYIGAAEASAEDSAKYSEAEAGIAGSREESYLESLYDYGYDDYDRTWDFNNEEYSKWEEKGYSSVVKSPLSTFSADVDTASYSNLRRLIREGYGLDELPEGSVRIEEMLNYFSYDYAEPKGSEPFGVTTYISKCPWNKEAELLIMGLKTEELAYEDAPPANLVFLLDVSGSMKSENKLPLLQEAFGMLAENLTEKDRVSIVTYAGEDTIVLNGVSGDNTRKIKKALNGLKASGGTNGGKGIETAYALAQEHFIKGGNNRIILATDGDLNLGLTSEKELEELITEKKESGIFLSVLGFGTGNIKDNKMELLADKGNGNYAYIDCVGEARKVLVEEMSSTLLTICKDVKLQVEFNPAVVSEYRLIGYENRALNREDFADDTKDAGEIGTGHSITVMYELILKEPLSELSSAEIENLRYSENYKMELGTADEENPARTQEWITLSVRYKKPAEEESRLLQYPVNFDSYLTEPGDDFRFAAAVAEFGLLASHSEYSEDASLKNVKNALKKIELNDEYKKEFRELVENCG